MGIDFGTVRIGIALSDPMRIISSPFETYLRKNETADVDYILSIINSHSVKTVVFGLPLNMDGTEGETALKVRKFAQLIKDKCNCEIVFQDERLSSLEAEEILINSNVKREKRKQLIDKLAAQIILQTYIERS